MKHERIDPTLLTAIRDGVTKLIPLTTVVHTQFGAKEFAPQPVFKVVQHRLQALRLAGTIKHIDREWRLACDS